MVSITETMNFMELEERLEFGQNVLVIFGKEISKMVNWMISVDGLLSTGPILMFQIVGMESLLLMLATGKTIMSMDMVRWFILKAMLMKDGSRKPSLGKILKTLNHMTMKMIELCSRLVTSSILQEPENSDGKN